MALVLAEYADEPVDQERVVKMVLIHDEAVANGLLPARKENS